MHPLQLAYAGGMDAAFSSFGLEKTAVMNPQQQAAALQAFRNRPKGIAAVQAVGGAAPQVPHAPIALSGVAPGYTPGMFEPTALGGGPGMAPGFGPSAQPTAMRGAGSIAGQAAIAERAQGGSTQVPPTPDYRANGMPVPGGTALLPHKMASRN